LPGRPFGTLHLADPRRNHVPELTLDEQRHLVVSAPGVAEPHRYVVGTRRNVDHERRVDRKVEVPAQIIACRALPRGHRTGHPAVPAGLRVGGVLADANKPARDRGGGGPEIERPAARSYIRADRDRLDRLVGPTKTVRRPQANIVRGWVSGEAA